MKSFKNRKKMMVALIGLVIMVVGSTTAFASQFSMSTQYPDTTATAGETVTFNLDIYSGVESGEKVNLSVVSEPAGFQGAFYGGGNQISNLYVKQGVNTGLVSYEVTIPEDAALGTYNIALGATSESGTSPLSLNINITDQEVGVSTLVTQYSEQEGSAMTGFTFNSTLQNDGTMEQVYSLSAEAPKGWTVAFMPTAEMTQVAAITVDQHASQGISITVTPPTGILAGTYTIPISAISSTETLTGELTIHITSDHQISLSTPSGILSFDANANKESQVILSVTNKGNVDLKNINLTSEAPSDWNVAFSESTIDLLEAGATKEVTAFVTPSQDALSGDYLTTILASTAESTVNAEFRVSVKTETIWGIVGVLVIALTLGGVTLLFRKYGRR